MFINRFLNPNTYLALANINQNFLIQQTKHFSQNFAAIHEIKPVWVLNKPIYVGLTILELSKYLMYGFHYNLIKKKIDIDL